MRQIGGQTRSKQAGGTSWREELCLAGRTTEEGALPDPFPALWANQLQTPTLKHQADRLLYAQALPLPGSLDIEYRKA